MANSLAWISGGGSSPAPDIYWAKLNENAGIVFTDSTVHGVIGTIASSGMWTSGVIGAPDYALQFNGTSDQGSTAAPIAYGSVNKITISFWWKPTLSGGVSILLESSADYNSNGGAWLFYYNGDGTHFDVAWSIGIGQQWDKQFAVPSGGTWHNILAVIDMSVDPNVLSVWIDGGSVSPTSTVASVSGTAIFHDYAMFLGARNASSFFATASLDDIRIYTGDVSASVAAIFGDPQ